MQLSMDQVDLAQVRLIGIARDAGAMLDRLAAMSVVLYTEPARRRMPGRVGFVMWCLALQLTAVTTPPMPSNPIAAHSRTPLVHPYAEPLPKLLAAAGGHQVEDASLNR